MKSQAYLLHALSPLHAGIGQSADLIDLPIARLKGTGIPYLPGSSVKGVLRDAFPRRDNDETLEKIFGPSTTDETKHAGALVCTDFRLLALPVRSFKGTFAYVTSPLLLLLAGRDLERPPAPITLNGTQCMCDAGHFAIADQVYFEDQNLPHIKPSAEFLVWKEKLGLALDSQTGQRAVFEKRLAIVDDETMSDLWQTATQLDQRIAIDPATRVVKTGALWMEESLPAETLMIGLFAAEDSRREGRPMNASEVLAKTDLLLAGAVLQFGGKSTVGRGRCRLAKVS